MHHRYGNSISKFARKSNEERVKGGRKELKEIKRKGETRREKWFSIGSKENYATVTVLFFFVWRRRIQTPHFLPLYFHYSESYSPAATLSQFLRGFFELEASARSWRLEARSFVRPRKLLALKGANLILAISFQSNREALSPPMLFLQPFLWFFSWNIFFSSFSSFLFFGWWLIPRNIRWISYRG